MHLPEFHTQLKQRRLRKKLSQFEASSLCGITQGHWSRIENGHTSPSPTLRRRISKKFNLGRVFARPKNAHLRLKLQAGRLTPALRIYLPAKDRSSYIRFRSASLKRPNLINELRRVVESRTDYDVVQQTCHSLRFDSELEVLFAEALLANDAKPGLLSPYSLGHLPHPVIDPTNFEEVGQHLHHCLIHQGTHYFFQVTFRTRPTIRVDVLSRKNGRWEAIEIDGQGHDNRRDQERNLRLSLRTMRMKELDVETFARSILRGQASQ